MDLMVNLLIDGLRHQFQQMPGPHSDGNARFSFDEIGMATISVFFVQSPSFLDHQRKFYEAHNRLTGDAIELFADMVVGGNVSHAKQRLAGTCQSVVERQSK